MQLNILSHTCTQISTYSINLKHLSALLYQPCISKQMNKTYQKYVGDINVRPSAQETCANPRWFSLPRHSVQAEVAGPSTSECDGSE